MKKELNKYQSLIDNLPDTEKDSFDWIGTYGRVALTDAQRFESFSSPLVQTGNPVLADKCIARLE